MESHTCTAWLDRTPFPPVDGHRSLLMRSTSPLPLDGALVREYAGGITQRETEPPPAVSEKFQGV